MSTPAKQPSPLGTWYTDAGEPADAWPGEGHAGAASGATAPVRVDALVASSIHAMAGAGGGLVSRLARLLGSRPATPIGALL